jgi:uncharacterized protein YchJ
MVAKLVIRGLSQSEAEHIMSSRKTAFNKAMREYMKATTPGQKGFAKKSIKLSKQTNKTTIQHA